jgi:hypothetical protein
MADPSGVAPVDGQRVGDRVCWRDDRDVWHCGEVETVEGGTLVVRSDHDGHRDRIPTGSRPSAALPAMFRPGTGSDPRPDATARLFLHALADAVDRVGVRPSDVSVVWTDGIPTPVFAPTVGEGLLNTLRIEVDASTPEDLTPRLRQRGTFEL